MVKTLLHEFLPIHMIGKQSIKHEALPERIKNQLYSGPNELVVTGCHSILVDSYANKEQCDRSRDVNSGLFQTDTGFQHVWMIGSKCTTCLERTRFTTWL